MGNSRSVSVKCQTKDRFDWSPCIVHYKFSLLSIENCMTLCLYIIIVLYCQIIILADFWLHKDTYFVVWNRLMAELDR